MSTPAKITAVCLAIAAASPALAGDLAYPGRTPYTVNQPLNAYSWAGPYLGGNLGYGWGDITGSTGKTSGFAGGAQAGYNVQSGPWVYGIEGDIQASSVNGRFASWKFSNPWFGTARGRIGYAFSNVLFYGTAGLAFGELRASGGAFNDSSVSTGWAAGLGVEFAFAPNWSAKAEYLYIGLPDSRFSFTGTSNGHDFGLVRVGVNYHF